jgi:PAS domain S-box-containing protein
LAAEPLRERLESSSVIGWLKDLDGRYTYVNGRYVEQFGAPVERIVGRTDSELEPRESVDGPRSREGGPIEDEPIQLEYRVAAFEGRPALAVMRFAVRDEGGDAVGVCGVAAPLGELQLARSECAALMGLERGAAANPEGELEHERRRVAVLHEA